MDNMIDKIDSIEVLVDAYLRGEASDDQKEALLAWVKDCEENRRRYQQLKNIWQVAHPAFDADSIDVDQACDRVMKKMRVMEQKNVLSQALRYWQYVAAVLLLPLFVITGYLYIHQSSMSTNVPVVYQELFSPYGTRSKISLPDGSLVWLNAGSSLRFPTIFEKDERRVRLCGEAFFEVDSDPDHPFIVQTDRIDVRAVGTAFNVEAYPDDSVVSVSMSSGKVNVSLDKKHPLSLVANERVEYDLNTSSYEIERTNTYKWYAWKDGALVFRDDPLAYVFKKLGQNFNVDIVLRDSVLANQPYRATFRQESLDEILRLLSLTAPIRYVYRDRTEGDNASNERRCIEVFRINP